MLCFGEASCVDEVNLVCFSIKNIIIYFKSSKASCRSEEHGALF